MLNGQQQLLIEKTMIHNTAILEKGALIDEGVTIGPYSLIGPEVELKKGAIVGAHVYITGNTKIGKNSKIYPFASIGSEPQDLKYKGEKNSLVIGDNTTIREYVTINPGTKGGGGNTKIGNNCLIMISSHIAHDCQIGDKVVIANNAAIAGHCIIDDEVILGGNSGVQQFTRIGKCAMIGGQSGVDKDIIPYGLALGNRSFLKGINKIGLRRKNVDNKMINEINNAYKIARHKIIEENNIYLLKNDSVKIKSVDVILFQNDTVIIKGIDENDCIINQYRHYFYDGMPVN